MSPEDTWGVIPGAPDYAINKLGRIVNIKTRRELKPYRSSYGYDKVALYTYGVRRDHYIHKLLDVVFSAPLVIPPNFRFVVINETGDKFRTVEECANFLQTHASAIYRVLRGERLSHRGVTFSLVVS